jgi:hypothetical protein
MWQALVNDTMEADRIKAIARLPTAAWSPELATQLGGALHTFE